MFKRVIVAAMVLLSPFAVQAQEAPEGAFLKGDIVYGSTSAPIEIIEYGSMTCPHCGHFSRDIFPKVKEEFIDTGRVRFIFRNFVRDRYDLAVATISRCTTDVDVTKKLVDSFFERQEEWMHASNPYEVIAQIAEEGGISQAEMSRCISDQEAQKHLVEMMQKGVETYKVSRIPYVMMNGKALDNYAYETIKAAVEAAE
ncbi:MAG: DsbA family protein [Alphaproteobacteria bacterium]|nr:DsbA family protein [Alphaproteobacteria bacterium]